MTAPELRTPRLRLRPLQPGDESALHRHWTDPEVRRYLWDGRVVSAEQVREVVGASARLFHDLGVGLWSLRPRDSAELLGCAGFWYFHEPPQLELLLSAAPGQWGRGLATEAAEGLLDYAFDVLGWPSVQGSADAPNRASLRVMEKLGMEPAGHLPGEFGTIEIRRVTREAWRARKAIPPSS